MGLGRCVVCGIRLYSSKVPRCEWCGDPYLSQILKSILADVPEFLGQNEPSSPRDDTAMAFIADVGGLASKHPYLRWAGRAITMLLERGIAKRALDAEKIWGTELLIRVKRILPLLVKSNLCGFRATDNGHIEVEWSSSSIVKRAHSWLQVDPSRNDTAAFLLGYLLLHAISETMELVDSGEFSFDKGVARLYPVDYDSMGRATGLRMPKGITSVISFVLGSWARGWNEFDEFTLHKFLEARGVTGKEYSEAVGLLSQTVPGISHTMLEYETYSYGGVPVKRFRYNKSVLALREHLRERTVER